VRDEWEFQRTCGLLMEAAAECGRYHRTREAKWSEDYDVAVQSVGSGLSVETFDVTGGQAAAVRIDPAIQERITFAQKKRDSHRVRAETYERWVAALGSEQGGRAMTLTFDDMQFFYPLDVFKPGEGGL